MKVGGEIVILIIIILGAFLIGGATYQGNDYVLPSSSTPGGSSSTPTETPAPTLPGGAIPNSTPTPTPNSNWTISVTLSACQTHVGKSPSKSGDVTASGIQNGNVNLEIEDTPNNWVVDVTSAFNAPNTTYTLSLPNDDGYNTKRWRLRLLSGGTEKAVTPTGDPTGC